MEYALANCLYLQRISLYLLGMSVEYPRANSRQRECRVIPLCSVFLRMIEDVSDYLVESNLDNLLNKISLVFADS